MFLVLEETGCQPQTVVLDQDGAVVVLGKEERGEWHATALGEWHATACEEWHATCEEWHATACVQWHDGGARGPPPLR